MNKNGRRCLLVVSVLIAMLVFSSGAVLNYFLKNQYNYVLIAMLVFSSGAVGASIPQLMSFQGRLTNPDGDLLTGDYNLTFRIYNVSTSGVALWSEGHAGANIVSVDRGVFEVLLGSVSSLDLPFDEDYYIETIVNGETLSPRYRLASSGYAFRANVSESESDPVYGASAASSITGTNTTNWDTGYGWGNHASAGYLTSYTETDPVHSASACSDIASQNTTDWNTAYGWGNHASAGYLTSYTETDPQVGSISTNYVPKWDGSALVTSSIYDDGTKVGIGTTNPSEELDVNGNINATPIVGKWYPNATDVGEGFWDWDAQEFNTNTDYFGWTSGADNITIKKAGYYQVCANLLYSSLASGDRVETVVNHNGATVFYDLDYASGAYKYSNFCVTRNFAANDYVKMYNPLPSNDRYGIIVSRYSQMTIYKLN